MYSSSFLKFEPNLSNIGSVPTNTSILILNGENDTQTPVQGALLLQQKLTELRHPDHILITYPNLGHEFYPSTQWLTQHGPIEQYVVGDLYAWLEAHSGFTSLDSLKYFFLKSLALSLDRLKLILSVTLLKLLQTLNVSR